MRKENIETFKINVGGKKFKFSVNVLEKKHIKNTKLYSKIKSETIVKDEPFESYQPLTMFSEHKKKSRRPFFKHHPNT